VDLELWPDNNTSTAATNASAAMEEILPQYQELPITEEELLWISTPIAENRVVDLLQVLALVDLLCIDG